MPNNNSLYRPEINGIRAFAVIAVIIYHFNKNILPSGYLGVDIFFVISGYVMTSSASIVESENFWAFLVTFYEKRIKRLLPPLIIFVIFASIFCCFFDFSPNLSLRTGMASLFGLSNLYLLKQSTDYFARSTILNIFTHTWSLGVEAQFYLFFPFLLWFTGFSRNTKRGSRNLFLSTLFLLICSLFSFLYLYQPNQPAAYFLMTSRFWEIAVGSLIFLSKQIRGNNLEDLEKFPPTVIFLLMICIMFLPISNGIPSTLAIVFLSAMLIFSLKKDTFAYSFFTKQKVIYIGLISYSLYLWHWGVVSISSYTIGIHWWSWPFQIILIYLFSVFSYELIEVKFRNAYWSFTKWANIFRGVISSISTASLLMALQNPLKEYLFLGDSSRINKKIVNAHFQTFNIDEDCNNTSLNKKSNYEKEIEKCFHSNPKNQQTLFFVGDSHSNALWLGAEYIANKTNSNLFVFSKGVTLFPPEKFFIVGRKRAFINDYQSFKLLEQEILKRSKSGDVIFINLRLSYYFGEDWYDSPVQDFRFFDQEGNVIKRNSKKYHFKKWLGTLQKFVKDLSKKNVKVVIFKPTPEFPFARSEKCKEQVQQWFNKYSRLSCSYDLDFFISKGGKYYKIIEELIEISSRNSNLYLFDSLNVLCPNSECNYSLNGNILYNDSDHLSNYSARYIIAPKILNFLNDEKIIDIN